MADPVIKHVSTIAELATAFNTSASAAWGRTIYIDNDLDFNNEGYYYHTNNFFFASWNSNSFENGSNRTIDGGIYDENQILQGNRKLTNIYMYPNSSLFQITYSVSNADATNSITIKNIDFEMILNQSSLLYVIYSPSSYKNGSTVITFENCNFNMKIARSSNRAPFCDCDISNGYAMNFRSQVKFINCTANIEFCNKYVETQNLFGVLTHLTGNSNYSYSGYSNVPLVFESCEFRIRTNASNQTINLAYVPSGGSGYYDSEAIVYVNNCAFFLNSDYNVNGSTGLYMTGSTSGRCYIFNSFFAAFAATPDGTIEADHKVKICFSVSSTYKCLIQYSFYDKERVTKYDPNNYGLVSGSSLYDLTTAECKSESKLKQIGFLFATET